jgi:hypothetical protein
MAVIDNRIKSAQSEFDSGCKDLDERHIQAVRDLETDRDERKEKLAVDLVGGIVGKVL